MQIQKATKKNAEDLVKKAAAKMSAMAKNAAAKHKAFASIEANSRSMVSHTTIHHEIIHRPFKILTIIS